jgi:hypothetical protein
MLSKKSFCIVDDKFSEPQARRSYKCVGGRHQKAMSSPVTSVIGLAAYRRTIVACFVFRRDINRKAVWDFFDSIEPKRK